MWKRALSIIAFILTTAALICSEKEAKVSAPSGEPSSLTEEQKEILKNREILENMELLQNLDKCRLFDLFVKDPDAKNESVEPSAGESEQKKK